MGIGISGRIAPIASPISVLPAPASTAVPGNEPSLDGSLRSKHNASTSDKGSGSSNQGGGSRTRPNSLTSRHSSNSGGGAGRQGSGLKKRLSAHRMPRPGSRNKGASLPFNGLPFQRESFDLSSSMSKTFKSAPFHTTVSGSDVIHLRASVDDAKRDVPVTCCQLCGNGFTNVGIRVPILLLCGHTYCSSCLEKARDAGPSALQCGVCGVLTCLDLQMELQKNDAILDLLASKEYQQLTSAQSLAESCAECEGRVATLYCAECAASYCQPCAKEAHQGSKVRSRHNCVAVAQKPCPQPTCKKHPGQSCVLYCETEKQPMCVLCKFYGQHRFHKYEMLGKTANQYCASVMEKLDKVEKMAGELDAAAKALWEAEQQVNISARKTQEVLEKHFEDMRQVYLTALEKREAALLMMVDKQVAIKQCMLQEFRMEIAASRARVLAAKEEASLLLKLNPVAALLSRKHTDSSLEMALKQSTSTPTTRSQPEVPLILHPDIAKGMLEVLDRHGGILQLPPMPSFTEVKVTTNTIFLQWESSDQSGGSIASDRTVTFSLHCFANQSQNVKNKLALQQMLKPAHNTTPESGFEEIMENPTGTSEHSVKFPPLLPSLVTEQRVQLVADSSAFPKMMSSTNAKALPSQETELRPGERRNDKVPLKAGHVENSESNYAVASKSEAGGMPAENLDAGIRKGNTLAGPKQTPMKLNLPPLIVSKPLPNSNSGKGGNLTEGTSSPAYSWADTALESVASDISESTTVPPTPSQGPPGEDGSTPDPSGDGKTSSTSSVDSRESISAHDSDYTNLGRYPKGYAYEEIYSGDKQSFHYSGLVPGAIYYFRVRSHNAAGWGPWSDTIKCTTRKWKNGK